MGHVGGLQYKGTACLELRQVGRGLLGLRVLFSGLSSNMCGSSDINMSLD